MLGDVAQLLEHGQVAIRLDVTHRAGVAIPVPGTPEVAGAFDDPDVGVAGLAEAPTHEQAAEAATDDDELDLVVDRIAFDALGVGVVGVLGELVDHLVVLLVAIGSNTLVSLGEVLGLQRVGIESELFGIAVEKVENGHGGPFVVP